MVDQPTKKEKEATRLDGETLAQFFPLFLDYFLLWEKRSQHSNLRYYFVSCAMNEWTYFDAV